MSTAMHEPSKAHLYTPERWRDESLDIPLWHRRTRHMVSLLRAYLAEEEVVDEPCTLLEFGCGAMALEGLLRTEGLGQFRYRPSDCHPRDERTLVLDLNDPRFIEQVPMVDVVFMGGVLEYLDDLDFVLNALRTKTRFLFFSYCAKTASQTEADRLGWKNHLSVEAMLGVAQSLAAPGTQVSSECGFDPSAPKPVSTYFVQVA